MEDHNTEVSPSPVNPENKAMAQTKIILIIFFVVICIFLGAFIYNLIKCYLPKWKRQRQGLHEEGGEMRKVEIDTV
jgi:preprotein translocase subunit SecG